MSGLGAGNLIGTLVVDLGAAVRLRAPDGDTEDERGGRELHFRGSNACSAPRLTVGPGISGNRAFFLPDNLHPLYVSWPLIQEQLIQKPHAFKQEFSGDIVSGGAGTRDPSRASGEGCCTAHSCMRMQPGAIPGGGSEPVLSAPWPNHRGYLAARAN